MNANANSIKMRGDKVCVFYGEKQALFDVDLEIQERWSRVDSASGCASLPSCVRLTA